MPLITVTYDAPNGPDKQKDAAITAVCDKYGGDDFGSGFGLPSRTRDVQFRVSGKRIDAALEELQQIPECTVYVDDESSSDFRNVLNVKR